VSDRIGDGEPEAVVVEGEVERVAADGVRRLEDPAHRDARRRAGEGREEVPLHLGRSGEALAPAGAEDHVGVPPLADEEEHEDADHRVDQGRHVRPRVVRQLQDTQSFAALGQRDPDGGRRLGADEDRALCERPARAGSFDRHRRALGPVVAELPEGDQGVVGEEEADARRAQHLAGARHHLIEVVGGEVARRRQQRRDRVVRRAGRNR
jgi:hypothetical protein